MLREEVTTYIRTRLAISDLDCVSLFAGAVSDRDIWAAVNQYPMDSAQRRLVVIRDAQRVKKWEPLANWLANSRLMPTVYLLFVSTDGDFYQTGKDDKPLRDDERHRVLLPQCQWIQSKTVGELVRCARPASEVPKDQKGKPTRPGPSDLVAWVQRQAILDDRTAEYLLRRVGGDLGKARNVCLKATVFGNQKIPEAVVEVLCAESAGQGFIDALLALDKRRACVELESLPPEDWSKTLGLLDYHLDQLAKLNLSLRERKALWEACKQHGFERFQVEAMWPHAKHYDQARRQRCRAVLTAVDGAVRSGSQSPQAGALEALVALW